MIAPAQRKFVLAGLSSRFLKTRLLAWLALKDVYHERLLSFCLVVALAGLVAPLLVLFGLKYGVIQKLQTELIEDPVNRELKPAETRIYSPEFFTRLRELPEVSFVVESVTEGASVIRVEGGGGSRLADMLPTADRDPLLIENNTPVPSSQQVVLSKKLADSLSVIAGDSVVLSAQRTENGDVVRAEQEFEVAEVLPLRADVLERAYVPSQFARDIESFREGFAVPKRAWPGLALDVVPGYQSIIFSLDRALSATEENRLISNSDFFHFNELTTELFEQKLGRVPPVNQKVYEVSVIDKLAGKTSVERVSRRLENWGAQVWLWNPPMKAGLQMGDDLGGGVANARSRSVTLVTDGIVAASAPSEARQSASAKSTGSSLERALPPVVYLGNAQSSLSEEVPAGSAIATLSVDLGESTIRFPVRLMAEPEGSGLNGTRENSIRLDAALLGRLSQGLQSPIRYNSLSGKIERRALGARGFRLFASSIYSVAKVRDELLAVQVPSLSSLQAIIRLQALDAGLTSLFLLIAVAGVVTSIIVLVANQIGSVQRKREALAQVRLLGLSKSEVSMLPLFTGGYLSLAGGLLGIGIALTTAWVINRFLASSLGFDDNVCVISGFHIGLCLTLVVLLTIISSAFAVIWTTRVDPADGMRYE